MQTTDELFASSLSIGTPKILYY